MVSLQRGGGEQLAGCWYSVSLFFGIHSELDPVSSQTTETNFVGVSFFAYASILGSLARPGILFAPIRNVRVNVIAPPRRRAPLFGGVNPVDEDAATGRSAVTSNNTHGRLHELPKRPRSETHIL